MALVSYRFFQADAEYGLLLTGSGMAEDRNECPQTWHEAWRSRSVTCRRLASVACLLLDLVDLEDHGVSCLAGSCRYNPPISTYFTFVPYGKRNQTTDSQRNFGQCMCWLCKPALGGHLFIVFLYFWFDFLCRSG